MLVEAPRKLLGKEKAEKPQNLQINMIENLELTGGKADNSNHSKLSQAFELLNNQVMHLTIADGIEDVSRAQTLYDKLERLLTLVEREQNKFEEGSTEWEAFDDHVIKIITIQNILFDFKKIFEK